MPPGEIVTPPPGASHVLPPSLERWITCPNQPLVCDAYSRFGSTGEPLRWEISQPAKWGPLTSHRWRLPSDVRTNAPFLVPTSTRTPLIPSSFLRTGNVKRPHRLTFSSRRSPARVSAIPPARRLLYAWLGGGNPVPPQAIAADNVLQTRVVSGLDQSRSALFSFALCPLPTTEMALQARTGGHMSDQDPGASPRRYRWGFQHMSEA